MLSFRLNIGVGLGETKKSVSRSREIVPQIKYILFSQSRLYGFALYTLMHSRCKFYDNKPKVKTR